MSGSFSTAEDELNFILGNDDANHDDDEEDLFDVDDALGSNQAMAAMAASILAADEADAEELVERMVVDDDFGKSIGAIPHISRMVSLSPAPPHQLQAQGGGMSMPQFPYFNDALPLLPAFDGGGGGGAMLDEEFGKDFGDFRMLDSLTDFDLGRDLFEPLGMNGMNQQRHGYPLQGHPSQGHHHLQGQQPLYQGQGMMPFVPFDDGFGFHAAPLIHAGFPTIIPPPLKRTRRGPLRKRKITGIPVSPGGGQPGQQKKRQRRRGASQSFDLKKALGKAHAAREARRHRRLRRAKMQAVHLSGGIDVEDIQTKAVEDSDVAALEDSEESTLLHDFTEHFDMSVFVATAWNQVYDTMVDTIKVQEQEAAAKAMVSYEVNMLLSPDGVPSTTLPDVVGSPDAPMSPAEADAATPVPTIQAMSTLLGVPTTPALITPKPIRAYATLTKKSTPTKPTTLSKSATAKASKAKAAKKEKSATLKTLPSGKDPESRRQRRLMRNRLSAQASRDRRKKAIDDLKAKKEQKEVVIEGLERSVNEQVQRTLVLERAVAYAREYLGSDRYERIVSNVVSTVQVIESN